MNITLLCQLMPPPIPDWSVCLPRVDTNQRWEKCRSQWPCIYKGRNFLLAWSNLFYRIRSLFLCQLSEIMPVFRIGHQTQNFVSQGPLIFNPRKKKEIWRFLTYQFVHSGYFHICFNILVQVWMSLHKNYNLPPIILCDYITKLFHVIRVMRNSLRFSMKHFPTVFW